MHRSSTNRRFAVVRIIAASEAAWRNTGVEDPVRFLHECVTTRVAGVHASIAEAAEAEGNADAETDVLLIVQATPDEFCRHDFLELLAGFPEARLVVAYGPWCVSDGRTRQCWPHAVRVPIDSATHRLQAEIDLHADPETTTDDFLPLTAAREEVFAFDMFQKSRAADATARQGPTRRIGIASGDPAYAGTVADLVRDARFEAYVINISSDLLPKTVLFDVLLLDVDPQNSWIVDVADRIRSQHPLARAIGLTAEPTGISDGLQQRLKLSKVVSKLAPLEMERLVGR